MRALLAELAEIRADRAMAARFVPGSASAWLVELAAEERSVRDRLAEHADRSAVSA